MGAAVMGAGLYLKGHGDAKGSSLQREYRNNKSAGSLVLAGKNQFLMTKFHISRKYNESTSEEKLQEKCNMDTESFFLQADSSPVLVPIRNWSTVLCAFREHILIYST